MQLGNVARTVFVLQGKANGMDSPKGPADAVAELLAEDLRQLICSLPGDLQESVPEQLKQDTRLGGAENETPKGGR